MDRRVVLIGAVSTGDRTLLERIACSSHFFTVVTGDAGTIPIADETQLPVAFFSFLSCTPGTVLELFGSLPLGAGEKIPLFQLVIGEVPAFTLELPVSGFFESPLSEAVVVSLFRFIKRNAELLDKCARLGGSAAIT